MIGCPLTLRSNSCDGAANGYHVKDGANLFRPWQHARPLERSSLCFMHCFLEVQYRASDELCPSKSGRLHVAHLVQGAYDIALRQGLWRFELHRTEGLLSWKTDFFIHGI